MKAYEIRLNHSKLTDAIYAGKLDRKGIVFTEKADVTNDFLAAVISRFGGFKENIQSSDGSVYEIQVKKLSPTPDPN